MASLIAFLETLNITNEHDLIREFGVKGKDVFLHFRPAGRASAWGTLVSSPSHQTNPQAHWSDYGQMYFGGHMSSSMPEASAWATEKYGIDAWVRSPFGRSAQVPAYVIEAAKAAMKAAKK